MALLLLWSRPATSYVCFEAFACPAECGEVISGDSQTYRIEASGFTSAQITQIENGAAMWSAGPAEIIRGAKWSFLRGADVTNAGINNGRPEVFARDQDWWDGHMDDPDATAAVKIWRAGCTVTSMDLVLHTEKLSGTGAGTHKLVRPSIDPENRSSLAVIVGHEFGHWLGLDHEDDFPTLMNTLYPSSGDIGQQYRIAEDDVVALQSVKPDSSVGLNLMIGKFRKQPMSVASEWNPPEYSISRSECMNTSQTGQYSVVVHSQSTSSIYDVRILWSLSPDDDCHDADQVAWGEKVHPGISMNSPLVVAPDNLCVPSGLPIGTYRVCVSIDPYDLIEETSEIDNVVRFDQNLIVTM